MFVVGDNVDGFVVVIEVVFVSVIGMIELGGVDCQIIGVWKIVFGLEGFEVDCLKCFGGYWENGR